MNEFQNLKNNRPAWLFLIMKTTVLILLVLNIGAFDIIIYSVFRASNF